MLRCIKDYTRMRDAEQASKALIVHAGLTKNAAFPDPPVKMELLTTATQQYTDAL